MPVTTAEFSTLARPRQCRKLGIILLLALLVVAPALVWHQIPERDSANYALLTAELADGNFTRAFHPSVPPLLTTLGGGLALLVKDPFRANQLASTLLFLLGLPGTFLLVKELQGERAAVIAAVLYAVCPQTVYQATSAGVDAGKLALLPWICWAALHWNRQQGAAWGATVGSLGAFLSLARGEGIFFTIVVLLWYVAEGIRQWRHQAGGFIKRLASLAGAVLVLLVLLSPWLCYQRSQTGLWITHPTQIMIYAWFGIHDRWPRETIIHANAMEIPDTEPSGSRVTLGPLGQQVTVPEVPPSESVDLRNNYKNIPWVKNLEKVGKGACIPYLVLAVCGVLWRRKVKPAPSHLDTLPLILIALNLAIFYPTNIMAPRYISATIPLFLHFTAIGVQVGEEHLKRWRVFDRARLQIAAIAGILVLALLSQGSLDVFLPAHKRSQQLELMHLGSWIRQHVNEFPTYGTLPNSSAYHNGRQPILLETDGRLRYYARTDGLCLYSFYRYTPEQITAICRLGKVSLIAYDDRMEALCPGFGQYWPQDPSYSALDLSPELSKFTPQGRLQLLVFNADSVAPR